MKETKKKGKYEKSPDEGDSQVINFPKDVTVIVTRVVRFVYTT